MSSHRKEPRTLSYIGIRCQIKIPGKLRLYAHMLLQRDLTSKDLSDTKLGKEQRHLGDSWVSADLIAAGAVAGMKSRDRTRSLVREIPRERMDVSDSDH